MKTLLLKLPESLFEKLDSTARKRGEGRSVVLREAIERLIGENTRYKIVPVRILQRI